MIVSADGPPDMEGHSLLRRGPLARYVVGKQVEWVGSMSGADVFPDTPDVIASYRVLQDQPDYRAALRRWFERLAVGGHLIVVVPHAFLHERQMSLPSRWHPNQRRLYTPASLLDELEEALSPNSYRVRWLGDLDGDYDYGQPATLRPLGESDVGLVVERITPPPWLLDEGIATRGSIRADTPDFAFEPAHTRMEVEHRPTIGRVLVMKLDHLGDLIMAIPALERIRRYFPSASIDLLVGSWNVDLAAELNVANRVLGFDAFPRNSSEAEANVDATVGQFRAQITDRYDLAIDLRCDVDTRPLLRTVQATFKAGLGTKARFPFLDIALPLDGTRNEAERAREEHIAPDRFAMQGSGVRRHFGLYSHRERVEREHLILWGPYLELDPGDYIFDFYIDLQPEDGSGLLHLDIALDRGRRVQEMFLSGPGSYQLHFRVDKPKTVFEARVATYGDHPSITFGFHGGRLIKKGPGNVLHQSEYAVLLAELVKLRMLDLGMLSEMTA